MAAATVAVDSIFFTTTVYTGQVVVRDNFLEKYEL